MSGTAMTVLGPVPAAELGYVQMHEHLFCDLTPYGRAAGEPAEITLGTLHLARQGLNPVDYVLDDETDARSEMVDYRAAGGATLVDATSGGLGRDPGRLVSVSRATGVHVVMGSGYYVAPFHPETLAARTVESIAEEIIADHVHGVGDTGIKAGIIGEIGMSWPPTADEDRVLRAAALAQQATGTALLLHPGRGEEAPAHHLRVIAEAGGDLSRTIVSHIDRTIFDVDAMSRLAESTGSVLEFDLFGDESSYYRPNPDIDRPNDGQRVRWIGQLIERGFVDQIVFAQDICRKTRLKRWGGEGYAHILTRVIPLMLDHGISAEAVRTMTVERPAQLLARRAG